MIDRVESGAVAARELLEGLGDVTVLVAMSPQIPHALLAEVVAECRRTERRLHLLVADVSGRWDFADEAATRDLEAGRLAVSVIAGSTPRRLAALVTQVGGSLFEIDRRIARGELGVDIFLARVRGESPGEGFDYGSMIGYSVSAMSVVRRIGLEAERRPARFDGAVAVVPEAHLVWMRVEPVEHARGERREVRGVSDIESTIAQRVADLIPDGATIQLGLGAVPGAVVGELSRKTDLGMHSGILDERVAGLFASGSANGRRKERDRGRHVATGVLSDDDSPWDARTLLKPVSMTHAPETLAAFRQLWAVNSAFDVTIAGEVNAEHVAGQRLAAGGGQLDFARGAHLSCRGSVIALPSRTSGGRSRIVGRLAEGHAATTTSAEVDYVVTEHGVAELSGVFEHDVQAMIAIAHPLDREALREKLARKSYPSV